MLLETDFDKSENDSPYQSNLIEELKVDGLKQFSGMKAVREGYTPVKRKESYEIVPKFASIRVDLTESHPEGYYNLN